MDVKGTVYIYCCNYEDLLRKVANIQSYPEYTVFEDDRDIQLQIAFSTCITLEATSLITKSAEVTINSEEKEVVILPIPLQK